MSKPMFENDGISQNFASEAQAVAELATRRARPRVIELISPMGERAPVLALPKDLRLESAKAFFDAYRTEPERRQGVARLFDLESFIAHAHRFRDEGSALFADPSPSRPTLTAVFDYHFANVFDGEGTETPSQVGRPRFGVHRAVYDFPVSEEWKAWTAVAGKPLSQGDFATFLEDRIFDVTDPLRPLGNAQAFIASSGISSFAGPSTLQQLAQGLTIHVDERATTKINPATGECTMLYETEHHGDPTAVAVPRAFLIAIPVFRSGDAYQLPVRLRYRLAAGRISWIVDVHDARKAFDDALRDACRVAYERTGLPLYYGSPEQ